VFHSKPTAGLLLILALGCWSCAIDGGSRGSGITTAQGNVDSVQTAALRQPPSGTRIARFARSLRIEPAAFADTGLEGIMVAVEGTSAIGTTDANGFFSIRGRFEGDVSILFQRAEDGLAARIMVDIPAGGTLTLDNVHIDNPSGRATPMTQGVDFEGLITQSDCTGETLTLVSSQRGPTDTDTYTVRLGTSSLRDHNGNAIGCQELQMGGRVHVTGSVNGDGTFGQAAVQEEN
jgi:hypothetical protein